MAGFGHDCALSLAHLSELELEPAALIRAAAAAGFQSVGLRVARAAPGGVEYDLASATEQAELRALVQSTGVHVLYVEMISLDETTRVDDYRAMLERGAQIGASRVAVAGNSSNISVVAEKMAEVADIARPLGLAVDLEFMPFRGIKSFADAVAVVKRSGRVNAHVLVDALHVFRSGSKFADIAASDPKLIGTLQLCDAPANPPESDALVVEARTRRLIPGEGGLALTELMDALPGDTPLGVEVPLAGQYPAMDPAERLKLLAKKTRDYLKQWRQE